LILILRFNHITLLLNQVYLYLYMLKYLFGLPNWLNRISDIMVRVLASSAVDCGFEPQSGQTNDYKIGICCFSAKHAALRRKSKDWLARIQDNVSELSDMSIRGLLWKSHSACWSSTKRITTTSHWKLTCSRHDIAEKLLNWR
jgi:hypothetical protein